MLLPLQDDDEHWEKLWVGRWGSLAASNCITQRAVKLAGGWKKLFRSKAVQDQASTPWVKACPHEVQVGTHTPDLMLPKDPAGATCTAAADSTRQFTVGAGVWPLFLPACGMLPGPGMCCLHLWLPAVPAEAQLVQGAADTFVN